MSIVICVIFLMYYTRIGQYELLWQDCGKFEFELKHYFYEKDKLLNC